MCPAYVPYDRIISDIKRACSHPSCGGIKLLWNIAGSGKSSYIKHAIRELLESKSINGCIFVKPRCSEFYTLQFDSGQDWFSQLLQIRGLISPPLSFTDFIDDNIYCSWWWCYFIHWFDVKKRIVVVIDQFENYWNAAEEFNIERFLKVMAETANATNHVVYLIATNNAHIANKIININERSKIACVGECVDYKWSSSEILSFFEKANFPLPKEYYKFAEMAGTPKYCSDLLMHIRDKCLLSPETSAKTIESARKEGWKIANAYINNYNYKHS